MQPGESLPEFIERLSALPARQLLEAFRGIDDPAIRKQVVNGLPLPVYADMMTESMCDNLNRNVQERLAAQKAA